MYDVAVARWKHEAERFEELGLGKKGLDSADLRAWMWNWHQKLQARIAAELTNVLQAEAKYCEYSSNVTASCADSFSSRL